MKDKKELPGEIWRRTAIDNNAEDELKVARSFITSLQEKKAMGGNWKLDIFIDKNAESLAVGAIPPSAAFRKGKFEFGVFLNKYRFKGWTDLETKDNALLASFPTKKSALEAVPYIIGFIKHRYNMELGFADEVWTIKHRSHKGNR